METLVEVDLMDSSDLNEKYRTLGEQKNVDFSTLRSIQIRCVLKAILISVECAKTALLLPKLLKHPHNVAKVLDGTKYQPAIRLVEDYIRRRDIIVKEQRAPLSDHGMIKLIDYFQKYPGIFELFPNIRMNHNDHKLIGTFEQLYKIAKHHILRTSHAEINRERVLHKLYQENEKVKGHITQMQANLAKQLAQVRWKMAVNSVLLKKCEANMEKQKMAILERMHNESERCQRIIRNNRKDILEKQKLLEEELKNVSVEYQNINKIFQRKEKLAREEKNKFELLLEGALRKYDRTISEKMIEHLDLEHQLKNEQKLLDHLMITYRKEEAIYNNIVIKREEEEERNKQNAILRYMMNHAARKIQTYWRTWRKNLLKEKRGLPRKVNKKSLRKR